MRVVVEDEGEMLGRRSRVVGSLGAIVASMSAVTPDVGEMFKLGLGIEWLSGFVMRSREGVFEGRSSHQCLRLDLCTRWVRKFATAGSRDPMRNSLSPIARYRSCQSSRRHKVLDFSIKAPPKLPR